MKNTLTLLYFLIISFLSESKTTFIYVDASDISNRESLIKSLKNFKSNDSLIYFFSNDKEPIHGNNLNQFKKDISIFNEIKPGLTAAFDELDSMNSKLLYCGKEINFFFYIGKSTAKNNFTKDIIDRILLCNSWLNKSGITENISIGIILPKDILLNENELNLLSKQKQINIQYF